MPPRGGARAAVGGALAEVSPPTPIQNPKAVRFYQDVYGRSIGST